MTIFVETVSDVVGHTQCKQIRFTQQDDWKDFQKLVQRAVNAWLDASPAIKAFADLVTEGKVLQDYSSQKQLTDNSHIDPSTLFDPCRDRKSVWYNSCRNCGQHLIHHVAVAGACKCTRYVPVAERNPQWGTLVPADLHSPTMPEPGSVGHIPGATLPTVAAVAGSDYFKTQETK